MVHKADPGYFLWLVPDDERPFQQVLDRLKRAATDSPRFSPHVTLSSPISLINDEDTILLIVQKAVAKWHESFTGLDLKLNRIDAQAHFFRALYVLLDKTPSLLCLQRLVADALLQLDVGCPSAEQYMPHLSLLYAGPLSPKHITDLLDPLWQDGTLEKVENGLRVNGHDYLSNPYIALVRSTACVEDWEVVGRIVLKV